MKKKNLMFVFICLIISSCAENEIINTDPKYQSLKVGYHFDDFSTGKALDFSQSFYGVNIQNQKNNAVPSNLLLVDGKFGKAILFDNPESALYIPYGLKTFTKCFVIDFWINLKTQPDASYRNIINETMAGSASTFRIGLEDNYISYDFVSNPTVTKGIKSSLRLEEDTWYHISFIYNGSALKLFINGDIDTSKSILMGTIDSWNSFNMGYFNDYYGQALTFHGIIDELRIWDYAFTDSDIKDYLMVTHQF